MGVRLVEAFFSGILAGVLLCVFASILLLYFKVPVERTLHQVQSKLREKGKIIEPESEDIENWISDLKDE